ncbi:uncharacterized protein DS421_11g321210 [Arachis hypogaea]|nr:uncharacterized protein DS421_11g321210 [Arachis hypogaea]
MHSTPTMFPSSSNSSTPRFLSLFHERNESEAERGRWSRATNRGGTSRATVAGHLAAVPRSHSALVTAIFPQPHGVLVRPLLLPCPPTALLFSPIEPLRREGRVLLHASPPSLL